MLHALKQERIYFAAVLDGRKTFEVRNNDRQFMVGDLIALNEYDAEDRAYTGRSIVCRIDYILNDSTYVKEGYVVLGIKPCCVAETDMPQLATHSPCREVGKEIAKC